MKNWKQELKDKLGLKGIPLYYKDKNKAIKWKCEEYDKDIESFIDNLLSEFARECVETKSKNSNFRMLEVISKKELIKICENWGVKLKD